MVIVEIGIFCALLASSFALPSNDARIVGGPDAEEGQFPHQVSLRYFSQHFCGGSIIANKWVVTSAHCVFRFLDLKLSEFVTVLAGTNSLKSFGIDFKLEKIIIHEDFDRNVLQNNIALLELEQYLNFSDTIKSIKLARDEVPDGADIIISGWGLVNSHDIFPDYLKYNTNIEKLSTEDCQALLGPVYYDGLICLVPERGNGPCLRDNGGPATYGADLVGVTSFGTFYGAKYPDIYTKISYFRDWINEKTGLDL